MADERIDIEVTDKVAKTIKPELVSIAKAARDGYSSIRDMQKSLNDLSLSATNSARNLAAQARAQAQVAAAAATASNATAKQTAAEERLALAQAKTALAQQKVATEAARTAEAQSRANIAYLKEEEALNKAISAEQRALGTKQQLTAAAEASAAAADKEAAAQQRIAAMVERSLASQPTAKSTSGNYPFGQTGEGSAAQVAAQSAAMRESTAALEANEKAQQKVAAQTVITTTVSGRQRAGMQQLGYQINDVTTMWAMGAKPMQIFASQAGQVVQAVQLMSGGTSKFAAFMNGPWGIAATAATIVLVPLISNLMKSGEEAEDATPKTYDFAKGLDVLSLSAKGATDAMQQLVQQTQAAIQVQGNFLKQQAAVATASVSSIQGRIASRQSQIAGLTKLTATPGGLPDISLTGMLGLDPNKNQLAALKQAQVADQAALSLAKEAQANAELASSQTKVLEKLDKSVAVTGQYDRAIGKLNEQRKASINDPTGTAVAGTFITAQGYEDEFKRLTSLKDTQLQSIKDADSARKKSQREAESAAKAAERAAESRALSMSKVNLQLDNELQRMQALAPERAIQQRYDEIEEQLAGKKIKLNAQEAESIKAKIKAIQDYSAVQSQMDRIYEETTGPQRTYNATLEAADALFSKGAISAQEYARQIAMAGNALKDAQDPLASLNRQLDNQIELAGKIGDNKDKLSFLQQLEETYRARGESIYQTGAGSVGTDGSINSRPSRQLRPEVASAVAKNDQANSADYVNQQVTSAFGSTFDNKKFLDNYQSMLDKIKEMEQEGVVSHQDAAKAKQAIDEQYATTRLQNANTLFDALATLQNSKNKELAAIGKAAAIAQATIDGVLAVQKALASLPPPASYVAAAAVGISAATNVAKIAGIGFQTGGYTGNGGVSEVAGVVHGQEYVFDAASTARLGVSTLDALRSGSLTKSGAASAATSGGRANVQVINHVGADITSRTDDNGNVELLVEKKLREMGPKVIADDITRNPNSRTSQAISRSFQTKRNRN